MAAGSYSTQENVATVSIAVQRIGGSAGAVSAGFATLDGSAIAGVAYQAASGIMTWADGDSSPKTVAVSVVNQGLTQGSQSFTLSLKNPTGGASLGSPSTATITVMDDDAPLPSIQWIAPAAIVYGTPLSATQLNATANVQGTFSYTPAVGALLGAGLQTLTVVFTPNSGVNRISQTVNLTVAQAKPAVSWPQPVAINEGNPLSSLQLDAMASVPGSFGYSPALGTVLPAGIQTLSVVFTPTDKTDYQAATASVSLTVTPSAALISWPTPAPIVYGTPLSTAQLDATSSLAGSLNYSPGAGTILPAGNHILTVTFTPASGTSTSTQTTTIAVTQAMPAITWTPPSPVVAGTLLSGTQLNATASVPGMFVYTPASGTSLVAGNQTLNVAFTPTDALDYASTTASVLLSVGAQPASDCSRYSYSADETLCQVNSVSAPDALAVRVSSSASSPNQPILVLPTNGNAATATLTAIATAQFLPVSYAWAQVQPAIDSFASKGTAIFSSAVSSSPQVSVSLPASGTYQFQVTATDANQRSISSFVWINVWDNQPATGPGNIGRNPGLLPPPSVAMLSADPGPFQHPRLLFNAGDWAQLNQKTDPVTGVPESLAAIAILSKSLATHFDQPGTPMYTLRTALLQYAADGYPATDYNAIASTNGFTPGGVVPSLFQSNMMGNYPDTSISDALTVAAYLAWLSEDPVQPQAPSSAYVARMQQLATLTAAWSQFLLTTELDQPTDYTGSNSGSLAAYDLALAYDLTYNFMTAEQQAVTRDYLYTIGNLYNTGGGGISVAKTKANPPSTGQNGVDFPNLADGIILPALVIEGEENTVSPSILNNQTFGTYVPAANSADPAVTAITSWPYASQTSVRNMGRQVRGFSEFIDTPWGFHFTLTGYQQLGQNIASPAAMALARRGENEWVTTNLYQALLDPLYNLVPAENGGAEGNYDHHDGTGYANGSSQRNFYYVSKAMYPDDPMVDYVYRQATSGWNENALTRAILGQPLQTDALQQVAAAKQLGLTKFDPILGFAFSRNGWSQNDLALTFMNFTLGNGHYHAEANDFSLSALGRVWANSPGYHIVPGDAQHSVLILTAPGSTDASEGYSGQGPTSRDYLNSNPTGGPFHGVVLDVSEDPNHLWTWFAGDAAPAYNFVSGNTAVDAAGSIESSVITGIDPAYMVIPGLANALIPADVANLNTGSFATRYKTAVPYNSVQYAFRSILTVRGQYPYVLVIDDICKDGAAHDYRWTMNNSMVFGPSIFQNAAGNGTVWASLQIEPGATTTDATLYHSIDAGSGAGLPRLLVRDVSEQSTAGQPAIILEDRPIPAGGATPETNLNYGVDNNTHKFSYFPSRRLFIDRQNVVAPKYKVLLFPFSTGGLQPTTTWDPTNSILTIAVGSQVDSISFDVTNPDHRTRLLSFSRR